MVSHILDALDLPPEMEALQDAYWQKRRDWEQLEAAFSLVAGFMLDHIERGSDRVAAGAMVAESETE